MQKSLCSVFCCFSALLLAGAEIYVSPSGSNKNPGTAKAPLATITQAAAKAKPGDTVKIAPGIYREQITFRKSGKKGSPITFEGTRGKKGEYLTIVEAPGKNVSNWQKASEVAPGVWKAKYPVRPDLIMMDGKMIAYINKQTMALPRWKKLPEIMNATMFWDKFGPECKRLPGFDLLSMPAGLLVTHSYFRDRRELFWPVINHVLSGWDKGFLYVRFANGDTPEKHIFTASKGEGFILNGASFLTFKNLHLRGSRRQFQLQNKAADNTIENCLLMHGGARVRILDNTVKRTTIKNCVLTAGFIRDDLFQLRSSKDMRGGLLYLIFKYIIGTASSDDIGVCDRGDGTRILNNIILKGLIGMDAYGANCEVKDNVVREMSSVGICTGAGTSGIFTGNLVMNCGIPLRIHDLRGQRAHREEYHFRNLYVQAPNAGSQIYVHCESYRWGPDMVNFVDGTKEYKKNPPNPVDPGKIYIYHNTFSGGENFIPAFSVRYLAERFRSPMPFYFLNNLVKGSPNMGTMDQELFNGNLLYTTEPRARTAKQRDPEIAKRNRLIGVEESKKIWNTQGVAGLPDLTLKAVSPAHGCAIDVSRPFIANGKKYTALPGFALGYFKGKAPAAGAFQAGEDQKKFFEMHKKTEDTIKVLQLLRSK